MIHVVIGTKAQLIKMAPLLHTFHKEGIPYNYISTGQHKETMNDILDNFSLKKPDYILYDGKDIISITSMLIWMIKILWHVIRYRSKVFCNDKNGIVLVHGDTFSTLLGALIGKFSKLKVAHVESGLRSFNLLHPFPEEITRLLTFHLSNYMFCPGDWAVSNLIKYSGEKINIGENTLYDALNIALPKIEKQDNVEIPKFKYAIVTLHRYENIYNYKVLERVVKLVEKISYKHYLLFILHKPTESRLKRFGLYERLAKNSQIEFRQRYDYFKFIKLVLHSDFVVSDGGSNQEECYYLGKPILLLRKATERPEGLEKNCILSQYNPDIINKFINNIEIYRFSPKILTQSPCKKIMQTCLPFISTTMD
ncbi:non-hydrolyzing UDP-N-acetylglucosamine 2-epimerase [Candidatus Venteria ishoeyi]|uniref:UDP-N-acetylglucosamine 2-epimerase n=1 Tax=Candidatus Venteria ishoeyi TaxID=1899563 RepID=A0A1H6F8Y8_9GAMM|nr:UDP-N-acetylglucosamine 2-epimerase (non-hydrolyzing) [Candidatus Venteria ishoeyi]SEH05566.1 UDP-N-acetylglucosamine 2-epimerase [Candidatus Venteria ishoeyi]